MPRILQKIKTHKIHLLIILCVIILGIGGWLIYERVQPTKLTIIAAQGVETTKYEVSDAAAAKLLIDFKQLKVTDTGPGGCTILNITLEGMYIFEFSHPNVKYYYLPSALNKWADQGVCSPISSGNSKFIYYPNAPFYYPTAKIYNDFKQVIRPPLPHSIVLQ